MEHINRSYIQFQKEYPSVGDTAETHMPILNNLDKYKEFSKKMNENTNKIYEAHNKLSNVIENIDNNIKLLDDNCNIYTMNNKIEKINLYRKNSKTMVNSMKSLFDEKLDKKVFYNDKCLLNIKLNTIYEELNLININIEKLKVKYDEYIEDIITIDENTLVKKKDLENYILCFLNYTNNLIIKNDDFVKFLYIRDKIHIGDNNNSIKYSKLKFKKLAVNGNIFINTNGSNIINNTQYNDFIYLNIEKDLSNMYNNATSNKIIFDNIITTVTNKNITTILPDSIQSAESLCIEYNGLDNIFNCNGTIKVNNIHTKDGKVITYKDMDNAYISKNDIMKYMKNYLKSNEFDLFELYIKENCIKLLNNCAETDISLQRDMLCDFITKYTFDDYSKDILKKICNKDDINMFIKKIKKGYHNTTELNEILNDIEKYYDYDDNYINEIIEDTEYIKHNNYKEYQEKILENYNQTKIFTNSLNDIRNMYITKDYINKLGDIFKGYIKETELNKLFHSKFEIFPKKENAKQIIDDILNIYYDKDNIEKLLPKVADENNIVGLITHNSQLKINNMNELFKIIRTTNTEMIFDGNVTLNTIDVNTEIKKLYDTSKEKNITFINSYCYETTSKYIINDSNNYVSSGIIIRGNKDNKDIKLSYNKNTNLLSSNIEVYANNIYMKNEKLATQNYCDNIYMNKNDVNKIIDSLMNKTKIDFTLSNNLVNTLNKDDINDNFIKIFESNSSNNANQPHGGDSSLQRTIIQKDEIINIINNVNAMYLEHHKLNDHINLKLNNYGKKDIFLNKAKDLSLKFLTNIEFDKFIRSNINKNYCTENEFLYKVILKTKNYYTKEETNNYIFNNLNINLQRDIPIDENISRYMNKTLCDKYINEYKIDLYECDNRLADISLRRDNKIPIDKTKIIKRNEYITCTREIVNNDINDITSKLYDFTDLIKSLSNTDDYMNKNEFEYMLNKLKNMYNFENILFELNMYKNNYGKVVDSIKPIIKSSHKIDLDCYKTYKQHQIDVDNILFKKQDVSTIHLYNNLTNDINIIIDKKNTESIHYKYNTSDNLTDTIPIVYKNLHSIDIDIDNGINEIDIISLIDPNQQRNIKYNKTNKSIKFINTLEVQDFEINNNNRLADISLQRNRILTEDECDLLLISKDEYLKIQDNKDITEIDDIDVNILLDNMVNEYSNDIYYTNTIKEELSNICDNVIYENLKESLNNDTHDISNLINDTFNEYINVDELDSLLNYFFDENITTSGNNMCKDNINVIIDDIMDNILNNENIKDINNTFDNYCDKEYINDKINNIHDKYNVINESHKNIEININKYMTHNDVNKLNTIYNNYVNKTDILNEYNDNNYYDKNDLDIIIMGKSNEYYDKINSLNLMHEYHENIYTEIELYNKMNIVFEDYCTTDELEELLCNKIDLNKFDNDNGYIYLKDTGIIELR